METAAYVALGAIDAKPELVSVRKCRRPPNLSFPRKRLCQKANFEGRKANPSFPPPSRHSRESGNPGAVEGCYSGVSPLHPAWIPAFAGMTISGVCASLG